MGYGLWLSMSYAPRAPGVKDGGEPFPHRYEGHGVWLSPTARLSKFAESVDNILGGIFQGADERMRFLACREWVRRQKQGAQTRHGLPV